MEKSLKRKNYLDWDEYFMSVALLSSLRSKDPKTRVGACIVNKKNRIVGIGYNGFPAGCSDDILPWTHKGKFLETKYAYVCHAEVNAILNSNVKDLEGCSLYVAHFPCNECAKMIIQAGIKEVVYLRDKDAAADFIKAAKKMFDLSRVLVRRISFNHSKLMDLLKEEELKEPPDSKNDV